MSKLKVCRPLLVIFCLLAVQVWASASPVNKLHLLRPGLSIADLDGDEVPDTVSGVQTVHNALGYFYRIDLDLSGDSVVTPFTALSSEPMGLNIEARDVDGDRDLDLIISSYLLRRPIGIWLNNGKGLFSPSDVTKYVPAISKGHQRLASMGDPTPHVVNSERRRIVYMLTVVPLTIRSAHRWVASSRPSLQLFSSSHSPSSLRAPPSQF